MKSYSEDIVVRLLEITASCDDGCFVCVGNIFERIQEELPELVPLAHRIFLEKIGYDYLKKEWVKEDDTTEKEKTIKALWRKR